MIVAPNSPSARAQHSTAPPNRAGIATGTVTNRNTCHSLAPSTRAASSYSRGTARKARTRRTNVEGCGHEEAGDDDGGGREWQFDAEYPKLGTEHAASA